MEKKEAVRQFVETMDFVPTSVFAKIWYHDGSVTEITPPRMNDIVDVVDGEYAGKEGEIVKTDYDDDPELYLVKLNNDPDIKIIEQMSLVPQYDDMFPMCGTMFVPENIDQEWIRRNLQKVADLGFRIYDSDDFGLALGIDGAGYDFYEAFWTPLYDLRGLKWHETLKVG